jgi:hypothetical protein
LAPNHIGILWVLNQCLPANGSISHTIQIRCVTTPDEAQKVLLDRLGLTLPQRLRRIDQIVQM